MNIASALSQWLIEQLEVMPTDLLRQGGELPLSQRIIEHLMGQREAAEVRALLASPASGQERVATVLLPGIMGSLLSSIRGISALLWVNPPVITSGYVNLLDLDDEGTGDRSPDVDVVPVGIEKFVYLKLILTLARETRLYEFPYDWRRQMEWNADILAQSISRWAQADPQRRFVLVGHSMGGLLARTYLARHPAQAERHVEQLVMLGSPVYGAPDAIMVFWGSSLSARLVSGLHEGNDVRRFASNLPSTYQLLPPPRELFPSGRRYPADWELYDARAWGQPIVRQDRLDMARALHLALANSDPQIPCAQIAGCNRPTLTDVWISEGATLGQEPIRVQNGTGLDSGDDTVPLWSAAAPGLPTYYVEEGHHQLPGNPAVLAAVLDLIRGAQPTLPTAVPPPVASLRLSARCP
jgi:pimeloyl-ACP methyl ester carboxylesterase